MTACLRFGTLLLVGSTLSFGASRDQLDKTFANDIQPLLATYCTRCHGPQLQTAEIDFSIFDDHGSVVRSRAPYGCVPCACCVRTKCRRKGRSPLSKSASGW